MTYTRIMKSKFQLTNYCNNVFKTNIEIYNLRTKDDVKGRERISTSTLLELQLTFSSTVDSSVTIGGVMQHGT